MSAPNDYVIHIPTEAAKDICGWVEYTIFRRRLTEEEQRALSIKIRFWIHMTRMHGDRFDLRDTNSQEEAFKRQNATATATIELVNTIKQLNS